MESYDVLVVGAGPAGGTAAWFMAKKGLKVLVVEKKKAIGIPVTCAEVLSWKTKEVIELPDHVVDHQLSRHALYRDHVKVAERGFSAFMINRGELDRYLALEAVSEGAELSIGTAFRTFKKEKAGLSVSLERNKKVERISCSILVGADGFGSRVARLAGFTEGIGPESYSVTYQYYMSNVDTDADTADFFMFVPYIVGGYAWIFPKRLNTANVGLGMRPHQGARAKDVLDTFLNQNEVARKKCRHAFALSQSASTLHTGGPLARIATDHILVIGEAAGHVHPVSGGGNYFAVMGGKMCSEICATSLEKEDFSEEFLHMFEDECDRAFANDLRAAVRGNPKNIPSSSDPLSNTYQS
jgi:digeranylgeranylglycerophospholipid reductase